MMRNLNLGTWIWKIGLRTRNAMENQNVHSCTNHDSNAARNQFFVAITEISPRPQDFPPFSQELLIHAELFQELLAVQIAHTCMPNNIQSMHNAIYIISIHL